MAATPSFTTTPKVGFGLLTAGAETDLQTPTKTATCFTAGANGSLVKSITVNMTSTGAGGLVATNVAGLVYVFIHDGVNFHLYDTLQFAANTASTTNPPSRLYQPYSDFELTGTWTVRCSQSIAGNQSSTLAWKVVVIGEDF